MTSWEEHNFLRFGTTYEELKKWREEDEAKAAQVEDDDLVEEIRGGVEDE